MGTRIIASARWPAACCRVGSCTPGPPWSAGY